MKRGNILLIAIPLITLLSCNKDETVDINNLDVSKYISLLKAGQYDFTELPLFTSDHIPELLAHRNETQVITKFPRNPISSFSTPECRLGIYILWTIESIRATAIDVQHPIERYPSLNPVLAFKNGDELEWVFDEASQDVAAKAYFDWWEANQDKAFEMFKDTDPLSETNYQWR